MYSLSIVLRHIQLHTYSIESRKDERLYVIIPRYLIQSTTSISFPFRKSGQSTLLSGLMWERSLALKFAGLNLSSSKQQAAFLESKQPLTSARLLIHFNPKFEIFLACDASSCGIGAVLAHRLPDGSEKPIAFASHTLSSAEKNYSQIEKEGLACVFGVYRFHSCLVIISPSTLTISHFLHSSVNIMLFHHKHQQGYNAGLWL